MLHIGISGPIAAGKSTLGKSLVSIFELLNNRAVIIPFASGLKYLATLEKEHDADVRAVQYFQSLGYDELSAYKGALRLMNAFRLYPTVEGVKPRQLFQYIGTEVGRDTIDQDIWIRAVTRQAIAENIVISDDLRFVNESNAVDIHVAITLEGVEWLYDARKTQYPPEYFFSNHKSEQERDMLRKPDFTIQAYAPTPVVVNLARSILEKQHPLPSPIDTAAVAISKFSKLFTPVVASGVSNPMMHTIIDDAMFPYKKRRID